MFDKIIKRNGDIVPFTKEKIVHAILQAANTVGGNNTNIAYNLTDTIIESLSLDYSILNPPSVEIVQDTVEKILIEKGHAKTAKAYILYRNHRLQLRQEKMKKNEEEIKSQKAYIHFSNGTKRPITTENIVSQFHSYSEDLKLLDLDSLTKEALKNMYNGMNPNEYQKCLINSARSHIEKHYNYSFLAARILFGSLYNNILSEEYATNKILFSSYYQNSFPIYIQEGIRQKLLSPLLQTFDMNKISLALEPSRDTLFEYLGAKTLHDRYLIRSSENTEKIIELPQYLWMRVAMGFALAETESERTDKAIEFYNVLSSLHFVSSTPALFNSGTTHSQLSSCFTTTIEDSLNGIFKNYNDTALLSKYAGGIGSDWTNIRSLGSHINGTNGKSQGVIPFLKIFNDIAIAVNQGGKRKGALAAYLEVWHGDIEQFIEAKKNTGDERRRLHDIHTALWICDLFMKRVIAKQSWTLFSPSEVPELHNLYGQEFEKTYILYEKQNLPSAKTIDASQLWKKIITLLFETGHPWITFKDACNIRNPQKHCGIIHGSNLCTEITLNTSDDEISVCNLGSINLATMIQNGELNESLLKKTVTTAVRMLDNVIDVNFHPVKEAENSNKRHRPIGLGIMGYQDALQQMRIPFDSDENLFFADRSMELISYLAINASSDLARERGSYSTFKGSLWDQGIFPADSLNLLESERGVTVECDRTSRLDWDALIKKVKTYGMRNSNCIAIAPTATIANIAGTTPSIEPLFLNIYIKENTDGSFIVVNKNLVDDLGKLGLWKQDIIDRIKWHDGSVQSIQEIPEKIRQLYKTSFEIDPFRVLEAGARRGKWIDQSASLNIFLQTTNGKTISDTYIHAWKTGLKTTYYLRTTGVSSIQKTIKVQTAMTPIDIKACQIEDPSCESCQ